MPVLTLDQIKTLKELRDLALMFDIKVMPCSQKSPIRFEPISLYQVDYQSPLKVKVLKNRSEKGTCFLCDNEDTWKYNSFRDKLLVEARTAL